MMRRLHYVSGDLTRIVEKTENYESITQADMYKSSMENIAKNDVNTKALRRLKLNSCIEKHPEPRYFVVT